MLVPLALLLCLVAWRAPHPMHLSMTEVVVDTRAAQVTMTVRVFGTDLVAATSTQGVVNRDSAAVHYVMDRLRIRDDRARPIPTRSCGITRRSDLVWVCMSAALAGNSRIELTNRVFLELFTDQVNIVQLKSGDRRRTVLFRHGLETQQLQLR